jgi:hypothetical protein
LVLLTKLIKGWNKSTGSFFRSLHLEMPAREILANVRDYPSGLRFMLNIGASGSPSRVRKNRAAAFVLASTWSQLLATQQAPAQSPAPGQRQPPA